MRYSPDHKEETRRRVVEAAAGVAKENGFGTSGVDTLMGAAGLKGATFYHHFGTKHELLGAIIEHEIEATRARLAGLRNGSRSDLLKQMASYMSAAHIENPASGCALPTLSAEVARSDAAVRQSYEDALLAFETDMRNVLGSDTEAWALLALSVGAVTLGRAVQNPAARDAILKACRAFSRQAFSDTEPG